MTDLIHKAIEQYKKGYSPTIGLLSPQECKAAVNERLLLLELAAKCREMEDSDIHGGRYSGPNFDKELKAYTDYLEKQEAEK